MHYLDSIRDSAHHREKTAVAGLPGDKFPARVAVYEGSTREKLLFWGAGMIKRVVRALRQRRGRHEQDGHDEEMDQAAHTWRRMGFDPGWGC